MSTIDHPRIDHETLRAATLIMADWLDERPFRVTINADVDPELAKAYVTVWRAGYTRAIFELRAAATADDMIAVPDDLSELDEP